MIAFPPPLSPAMACRPMLAASTRSNLPKQPAVKFSAIPRKPRFILPLLAAMLLGASHPSRGETPHPPTPAVTITHAHRLPKLTRQLSDLLSQKEQDLKAVQAQDPNKTPLSYFEKQVKNLTAFTNFEAQLQAEKQIRQKSHPDTPKTRHQIAQLDAMSTQLRLAARNYRLVLAEKILTYDKPFPETKKGADEKRQVFELLTQLHEDPLLKPIHWDRNSTKVYSVALQQQVSLGDLMEDKICKALQKPTVKTLGEAVHDVGFKTLYLEEFEFDFTQTLGESQGPAAPSWSLSKSWNTDHPDKPAYRYFQGISGNNPEKPRFITSLKKWSDAMQSAYGDDANKGKYVFATQHMPTRKEVINQFIELKTQMLKQLKADPNCTVDYVFVYRGHGLAKGGNALQGSATSIFCTKADPDKTSDALEKDPQYDPDQDADLITSTALQRLLESDPDLTPYVANGRLRKTIILGTCHSGSALVSADPPSRPSLI